MGLLLILSALEVCGVECRVKSRKNATRRIVQHDVLRAL